ncbi:hypothetical protein TRIP_E190065 [uncultured Spirochaetota bacterium]|nr:hypothetical protein TRIP_E190065 [uncultured Spirochaetota bacterium]
MSFVEYGSQKGGGDHDEYHPEEMKHHGNGRLGPRVAHRERHAGQASGGGGKDGGSYVEVEDLVENEREAEAENAEHENIGEGHRYDLGMLFYDLHVGVRNDDIRHKNLGDDRKRASRGYVGGDNAFDDEAGNHAADEITGGELESAAEPGACEYRGYDNDTFLLH